MTNKEQSSRTRESLCSALRRLMWAKDIDSLTISEIAAEAGVSRMALYRNYPTRKALFSDAAINALKQFSQIVLSSRESEDKAGWLESIFKGLKENAHEMKKLIEITKRYVDYDSLIGILFPEDRPEDRYELIAQAGAFLAILREWLYSGMQESAEEMAHICLKKIRS